MRLRYEPASEPLHIDAEWLFLNYPEWQRSTEASDGEESVATSNDSLVRKPSGKPVLLAANE